MMKYLITLMLCLALWQCSAGDPEQMLLHAEADIQAGNITEAQAICVALTDTATVSLRPTQMCRVALIYGKIYDDTQDLDCATNGAALLDQATSIDSVAVADYLNRLSVEDMSCMQILLELNKAINNTLSSSGIIDYDPANIDITGDISYIESLDDVNL